MTANIRAAAWVLHAAALMLVAERKERIKV